MIQLIKEKFLKNKFSVVTIVILTIIIIFMQTKLSFKDSKVENLNMEIKKLQENNIESTNKDNSKDITDISSKDEKNTYFEKIKQRFIEIGEMQNKIYDESLNGKVVNTFSWMDKFEITDKQIENLLKRLSGEKFKIKFSVENNTGFTSYKIDLIE